MIFRVSCTMYNVQCTKDAKCTFVDRTVQVAVLCCAWIQVLTCIQGAFLKRFVHIYTRAYVYIVMSAFRRIRSSTKSILFTFWWLFESVISKLRRHLNTWEMPLKGNMKHPFRGKRGLPGNIYLILRAYFVEVLPFCFITFKPVNVIFLSCFAAFALFSNAFDGFL